jgi:2-phospho-L-lactate guanylyltransferase
VVCDDQEVAIWARSHGAFVIWDPGQGLNRAVQHAVQRLAALGVAQVTVAHSDLPLAAKLSGVGSFEGITIVPDRHEGGTNVIALPTDGDFVFSYGPGSFFRHVSEARRVAVPSRILRMAELSWDVDLPADLAAMLDSNGAWRSFGPDRNMVQTGPSLFSEDGKTDDGSPRGSCGLQR